MIQGIVVLGCAHSCAQTGRGGADMSKLQRPDSRRKQLLSTVGTDLRPKRHK
jgi:hypothetical protein